MSCRDDAGAPGQAWGSTRHPIVLSARLPRAMAGSARTGFGVAAGRGADGVDGSTADGLMVHDGGEAVIGAHSISVSTLRCSLRFSCVPAV